MGHLAKPGDPYVSSRGEVIAKTEEQLDSIKHADRFIPVARRLVVSSRRNMNEMPANDPSTQMAINVILMYSLMGLTENEIHHITNLPLTEIQNLKHGTDYQTTFEYIFKELINVNSNSIQATLAGYASKAIDQIIELAEDKSGEVKDIVRLKANQDLLDRAGLSPDNIYGNGASTDDSDMLKIVIEGASPAQSTNIKINLNRKK